MPLDTGYIFSMFKEKILDHTIVLLIMDKNCYKPCTILSMKVILSYHFGSKKTGDCKI